MFAFMLEGLKRRWRVGGTQLLLILCVFAITGTITAVLTRQITTWLNIDASSPLYWLLKAFVLVFAYQAFILLVSIPFGQFRFFLNYEKEILRWFAKVFRRGNKG